MSLISILIPVYNTEKYLCRCLDSILSQTVQDYEVILVDDGSIDDSGKICDEYVTKDSRFLVVHKNNEGVAKARITAFENSHGKLITFIDSDDYVSPEYLERLSKPIIEDCADIVSCNYYLEDNGRIGPSIKKLSGTYCGTEIKDFISRHYFYDKQCHGYGMTVFLWGKMIKRENVLDGLYCGLGMWYAEDQISAFKILQNSSKLVLIADKLYYYVQHDNQASKKYDESLWKNIIHLLHAYQKIDENIILNEGLRIRFYIQIRNITFMKMAKAPISRKEYLRHLSTVMSHPQILLFFEPWCIDLDNKDKIIYWLLKFKLFNLYYLLTKSYQFVKTI